MNLTITQPSTGMIDWNGVNIVKSPGSLRAVLGYLPQDFSIYPNLTALEFLEYIAAIFGLVHLTQVATYGTTLSSAMILALRVFVLSVWWGELVVLGGAVFGRQ